MKMKIAPLALLVLGIISTIAITPSHAALLPPVISGRTDKAAYAPGDSGTLYITVRNIGTQSIGIKNITVAYPWKAFITDHWDGNFTTTGIGQAILGGQNYNTQYTFTVPTDGRIAGIFGGTIEITIGTDVNSGTNYPGSANIFYSVPTYQPLSLTSSVLPIIEIALLGVAVVMLALVWMSISKLQKKQ